MSHEVQTAIRTLAPAMAAGLVVLLAAWRPWRRSPLAADGHWGNPVAFALGFLAAFVMVAGTRGFMLHERWHWLWLIACASAILGVISACSRTSNATNWFSFGGA